MEIKRLGSIDAEDYWNLRLESLLTNPEAFITTYDEAKQRTNPIERTADQLSNQSTHTYGAFIEGHLRGVVTLHPETHTKFKHKGHILAMYVSPQTRGLGVGTALLEACTNHARSLQIEQLHLSVVATNQPALDLYRKYGFTKYGHEPKAIKINHNHYLDEELMYIEI
ncbi:MULTISPECIES: GNAT family N-acetyltransferase [Pontibacillus]|uniref:GNAT family N-acetyltransferase n=1 Tax=Pontibacillus chungwhensis TaxID=265426 RepID=A0ABY8UZG1_9BACI|nr:MULTISPECIES: GNAT family N-acetyltransferase [Pontibacillus]MCD5324908.1 GNAT family N-acetyltransferase [Pontibacillus sp. HN14]WIF98869.1 GNAT family N-acetyltransferase [Pontibacillus chungwhensis]